MGKKKKKLANLDDDVLLPARRSSSPLPPAAGLPDPSSLTDVELRAKIKSLTDVRDRLPDGGQKLEPLLLQCKRELARRLEEAPEGREDSLNTCAESPGAAFSEELKFLSFDKRRSSRGKSFLPQGERDAPQESPDQATSSSRGSSLACNPRKGKQRPSKRKLSDIGCPIKSPSLAGKYQSRRLSQRRRAANQGSANREIEEVQPVLLVDDEDVEELTTGGEGGDTYDNREDFKIYYPSRDDPGCIELYESDLKCLSHESYISSPIMNFYIKYLQRSPSHMGKRNGDCYIFNTYFYCKLEEALTAKVDKAACISKLRRWWKGVDIFRKAYIFLPIHGDMHWSLAIICIPAKEDDSDLIILHLDSLGLHPSSHIFNIVNRYLLWEWYFIKEHEAPLDPPISEKLWDSLHKRIEKEKVMVPQQKNEYDCGLFVLYFMQQFIKEAPPRLSKHHLSKFSRNWFPPEDASKLREEVNTLLTREFEERMLGHGMVDP